MRVLANRAARELRAQRGFNLGEMCTTLAIVGVVSAIAVPTFGNLYMNVRVKTIAAEFAADLRYARAEAISRRTPVEVVGSNTRGWAQGWLVRDPKKVLIDRTGPSRIEALDPSEGKITYTRLGTLTRPGAYSVLFHAPEFRWVQPRCVYVHPDGRPMVEVQTKDGACGRR